MKFKEFVQKARITRTPSGDFIGDARADEELPNARSWGELRSYLNGRGACGEAVEAGRSVWRSFERARRRVASR